jgi:hypothetical protein
VPELKLEGVVDIGPILGYDEILRVLAASHVLLLVSSQQHRLFFPSKLVEYLAACRPILALSPVGSEVEALLQRNGRGAWICRENDESAVARCVSEAWRAFQSGELSKRLPACPEIITGSYTRIWSNVLEQAAIRGKES